MNPKHWNPGAKPSPLLTSPGQHAIPICSAVLLKRNAKSDNDSSSSSPVYLLQLSVIHYQSMD
jgi:hypothetical protein